jgi:hypothetical protein
MINQVYFARFGARAFCVGAALMAAPAFADHMGPSGIGSGGGMNVISPETLDEGHPAVGFRLTYTRPDQRPDSELEALADEHVHAHNTDYNINASLGAAYGVTHELTISAELPYVRRDHLREGAHSHDGGETVNEVEQLGNVSGIGDLNLLAKYRLTHGKTVNLALIGGLKVPTGGTHRRSDDGERLETEHQPGTGSWDPIVGAAFGAKVGSFGLSASALYQLSTTGSQRTKLGDRLQGGIALSHRFGGQEEHRHHDAGLNHHHGDELDEHEEIGRHASWDGFLELVGEWEGRQKIGGEVEQESGGSVVWLAPGARYNSAGGLSFAASFGVPVWQDIRSSHPDNDYRLSLSIGKAF